MSRDQLAERAERIAREPRIRDDPREGGRGAEPVAVRVVTIAVVQQDDGTRPELAVHARPDLLGRNAGVGVPHAERPSEYRVRETPSGRADERVAVAVRRAKAARD